MKKSFVFTTLVFVSFTSVLSLLHVAVTRIAPIRNEWSLAKSGRQRSETLNKFFEILPRYPSQGVLVAGGTAYSYKGVTVDLLGLNNVQMAHADKIKDKNVPKNHASFNKDVFYKIKPDLFWLSGIFRPIGEYEPLKIGRFSAVCFKNIHADDRFRNEYSNCIIVRKGFPQTLAIFASNDFLRSLDTTHFQVIRY